MTLGDVISWTGDVISEFFRVFFFQQSWLDSNFLIVILVLITYYFLLQIIKQIGHELWSWIKDVFKWFGNIVEFIIKFPFNKQFRIGHIERKRKAWKEIKENIQRDKKGFFFLSLSTFFLIFVLIEIIF